MTEKIRKSYKGREFNMVVGENGLKYVPATFEDGALPELHIAKGNTKTGKSVGGYGHTIETSCTHMCECYKLKDCYGCGGNYLYPSTQLFLADNSLCFLHYGWEKMADMIIETIRKNHIKKYRWFTVGDIPNADFIRLMVKVGTECPDVKYWAYTKKYAMVNRFIEKEFGGNADRFQRITGMIFSHWRNRDGSFFPMDNPYHMPTSEFVPFGHEEDAENADHICPCSNPDVVEHCEDCSTPCYELRLGMSMALLEHSTSRTRKRDQFIRAAHAAIESK